MTTPALRVPDLSLSTRFAEAKRASLTADHRKPRRSAVEADWTKDQADWLISAAVIDLCPQEKGVLQACNPVGRSRRGPRIKEVDGAYSIAAGLVV